MVPELYQSMLSRASQFANSRIVLGVHCPLDIIASRSLVSYDLTQAFTNPDYIDNKTTTGTAINLPNLFTAATRPQQLPFGRLRRVGRELCGEPGELLRTLSGQRSDPYLAPDLRPADLKLQAGPTRVRARRRTRRLHPARHSLRRPGGGIMTAKTLANAANGGTDG